MILVLDTNIVIAALLWGGNARTLLSHAAAGRVTLASSPALLDELGEVLKRDKFAAAAARQHHSADKLTELYADTVLQVAPAPIPPTVRDAKDDIVIATAIAAKADQIVTGDQDLLILVRYGTIQILTPAESLGSLTEDQRTPG